MGSGALQLCRPININTAGGGEIKEWGKRERERQREREREGGHNV